MANVANISFLGTVLQDPTSRQVNNSTVVSLKVAVKTTKKQENSPYPANDIYDVAAWNKLGDEVIRKGIKAKSKIFVSGSFMIGEPWTDRQGKEHMSLRVEANTIEPAITGGSSNGNYSRNNNSDSELDF